MKPFLYETAEKIINDYPDVKDCLIVFPNKRTKYYFRRYFAEILGKTSKPPKMREIGEFIREITGFNDGDKLSLIFELYKVFKKYNTTYTFENFYRLGEIILSDFNEIDAWLVDPQQIYRNIKDLKEIDNHFNWLSEEQKKLLSDFWKNFLTEKTSKEKEMFIGLWNLLPNVYKSFTSNLIEKEIAYTGLIYKVLSEKIDNNNISLQNFRKIIFIGFNALNKAELKFFNYFKKQKIADFYWDTDNYYMSDKKQEAGDFLRKNFKNLNINISDFPANIKKKKSVKIIGTSLNLNQAKLLHPILKNTQKELLEKTAIITADESMLFPVLSSLPDFVENINVTMGYSFKLTPLYNFINKFLKMHLFAEKHKSKMLYFKDILNILSHPYIKEYNPELYKKIILYINKMKLIYINPKQLPFGDDKLTEMIFSVNKKDDNSQIILNNLLNILFLFFDKNSNDKQYESSNLKNEYIFRAYKKIKRLREILKENNESLSLKLTSEILIQILKSDTIPFESESKAGLQIMGLMETRNLDFENIIILGMNEGNIPKISRAPTFISQSLRFAYDLPLIKHLDSVYAYFFYRLLQRAENITLIYNDLVNDTNSGEMSRFILQLLYESNFEILHTHFNDEIFLQNRKPIEIVKDDNVLRKLDKYIASTENNTTVKMFSASALNTYLNCSLKFYFKYIAGINEQEKNDTEMTPGEFGSVLHKSLELTYNELVRLKGYEEITEKDISLIIPEVDWFVSEALKEKNKNTKNYSPQGIEIVVKNVLKNYVETILKYDSKQAPFKIISLENEKFYNTSLDIKIKDNIRKIKIYGIIDRIDKKEDIFRIIDYKSGNKPKYPFSVESLFDKKNGNRNSNAFQSLFYALIISNMKDFSATKIKPVLYYARTMNRNDFSEMLTINEGSGKLSVDENVTEMILPDFKEKLIKLTEEIFDDKFSLTMTENTKNCEYCEFNKICY